MKKNKNGFTLVELLAVVIVLIIIILIAVNMIRNNINKTADNAIVANAGLYIKAVNGMATIEGIEDDDFEDLVLTVAAAEEYGINISGTKPDSGILYLEDSEVVKSCLTYDGYKIEYNNGQMSDVTKGVCDTTMGKTFAYSGHEETYDVKMSGLYKLEAWGAQGGSGRTIYGGYGAYSTITLYLEKGTKLYINVGGKGQSAADATVNYKNGGYNGGGNSRPDGATAWGAGGGATSFATKSGTISRVPQNQLLLVAAGGGGGGTYNNSQNYGGHAGGYIGNRGTGNAGGYGGSQTAGGSGSGGNAIAGSYGQGANCMNYCSGGGGGLYGGGTGYDSGSGGGGGSSYLAANLPGALNGVTYCYSCTESNIYGAKTKSVTSKSDDHKPNTPQLNDGYAKIELFSSATMPDIETDADQIFATKFADYKKVEYITSSGSQYIDTEIVPDDNTGVYAKVVSNNTSSDLIYFGSKPSSDARYWVGNVDNRFYFGWNTAQSTRPSINTSTVNVIKMNYLNNRKLTHNDVDIYSNIASLNTNDKSIYVFSGNNNGSSNYQSSIKLYELKFSWKDKVFANFIPCRSVNSETEVGLCELQTGKFYGNKGTGTITPGPDVE